MFHLLGFLFIIIIAVLVIGLSLVGSIFRAIFGFGSRTSSGRQTSQHSTTNSQTRHSNWQNQHDSNTTKENTNVNNEKIHQKKIFSKDEGEYIDFEEIK